MVNNFKCNKIDCILKLIFEFYFKLQLITAVKLKVHHINAFTGVKNDSNKKRTIKNNDPSFIVDNSVEITNISYTPKDLIGIHHLMTIILKR